MSRGKSKKILQGGWEDYHAMVTAFVPDTIYRGKPFDYAVELSGKDYCNEVDAIKAESPVPTSAIRRTPTAEGGLGLSTNSLHRKEPVVNTSSENILSEEDQNLLFDEEFYSIFEKKSKDKIKYDIDGLERDMWS
jgi:hypothetical protein